MPRSVEAVARADRQRSRDRDSQYLFIVTPRFGDGSGCGSSNSLSLVEKRSVVKAQRSKRGANQTAPPKDRNSGDRIAKTRRPGATDAPNPHQGSNLTAAPPPDGDQGLREDGTGIRAAATGVRGRRYHPKPIDFIA